MKSDSAAAFVDANVLVYAAVADDPRNAAARALLTDATRSLLYISPQIVAEFYSTITSPKRVTAPYTPEQAFEFIEILLAFPHIAVLPISEQVPAQLLALLKTNPVKGPRVFDVQIVATMIAGGVTKLFTYNEADFRSFEQLEIIEPPSNEGATAPVVA
jgi:predicted nucleic acid-binding protein